MIIIPLIIVIPAFLIYAQNRFLTYSFRYANRDYMSIWAIGRAVLENVDPYEAWIPLRAKYGSEWFPASSAPYPLWTGVVLAPFALFRIDVAAAIWLTLSEILLGVCLYLLLGESLGIELKLWEYAIILLSTMGSRWMALTLLNGQMIALLLFIIVLFVYLLGRDRPFWAGFSLAFLSMKPNPFIFFLPLIAAWLLVRRRWHTVSGGIVGLCVLTAVSWLIRPGWISSWLWVRNKAMRAPEHMPTVWGFSYMLSGERWPIVGMVLAIVVIVSAALFIFKRKNLSDIGVVAILVTVGVFLTPYAWAYEQLLLVIPVAVIFAYLRERWFALPVWAACTLIIPWVLYWLATQLGRDRVSAFVPIMIGIAALLVVTRRDYSINRATQSNLPETESAK
jgi:hypothetical protein